MMLTRRSALLGLTSAFTLGRASLALAGAPTDRRFVVVIMRGALDGMSAVVPYGDAALASLRPGLVPPGPGQPEGVADLGGFFGLHPALVKFADMYRAGQLLPVHAVSAGYRTRSHFEGQDYLESGADHRLTSGWLNRAVLAVAQAPARAGGEAGALSVGVEVPLLLRGSAEVGSWAPHAFGEPEPDLYARVAALHAADPLTGPAIAEGLRERGFAATALGGDQAPAPKDRNGFPFLAQMAGRLMRAADGPRIAALEIGGWDTHADQMRRLQAPLSRLDEGLAALRDELGDAWAKTAVLVMTEFGRTVRMNGTNGTDHGTATVAFVLGGAVAGGRVLANWPGLGPDRLLENRDLMPTADLRSLAKGLLAQHYGLGGPALASVFPDSGAIQPARGLLRA
ncbi:MAG TPA: DUF1501 domain-containing protein [Acidisphaera sp.]|nr:DUF1501 domain-containing protein [Acidisphaera sp.]